jgi:hypothetical protein
MTARAVSVDPADTSCTAIRAIAEGSSGVDGTILQFTASSQSQPPPQTQSGGTSVTFSNAAIGSYTLDPLPPSADWMFARACWRNVTTGAIGEGFSVFLPANETIRWDVGYTFGTAWVQTQGGDVYASGTLRSYLPQVSPRVFDLDGTGGFPGVVSYGTVYDFDSEPLSQGNTLVSSTNWQVNTTRPTAHYYDFFYRRYGSPTMQQQVSSSERESFTINDMGAFHFS